MTKVVVGKIVNTCGLKGEVKILNYSDFSNDRYKKGNKLEAYNEETNVKRILSIESYRKTDKFVFLKFKEINSIEEAQGYKEFVLMIDSETFKKLDEDTFYYYELMNLEVYYNGKRMGVISEVTSNGRQSLLRIKNEDKTFLVPFLNDFIEKIDIEKKSIVLKNIEGLL